MLDEVLFMEARLFRMFWQKHGLAPRQALDLFETYNVWEFIESCYDSLHTSSDACALADIDQLLANQGATL